MSFSLQVKSELARLPSSEGWLARAELAGLVRSAGSIHGSAGRWALKISVSHSPTARRAFLLMKVGFDVRCDIVLKKRRSPRRVTEYVIRVPPKECERVLKGLGILVDGGYETHRLPDPIITKAQARRAYLRGAFLGSGSVANPEKAHHLEVRLGTEGSASALKAVLAREGITPGFRAKNGGWLVYLKECEPIVAFLALVGSHGAVLRYQNVRVLRDVKSRVNRVVNCETANVSRIVETGLRQLEEILFIDKTVGLSGLSPGLRELAQLRMRHPELSLSELGLLLEPAIGKSGVNHRLRRLSVLATELGVRGRGANETKPR